MSLWSGFKKSLIFFGICMPALSVAAKMADVQSTFYKLTENSYAATDREVLAYYLSDEAFGSAIQSIKKLNPGLYQELLISELASIETTVAGFEGLGSDEPFVYEAKKVAADLGAAILVWKSGIEFKNTKRTSAQTFICYRVEHKHQELPGAFFSILSLKSLKNKDFENALKEFRKVAVKKVPKITEEQSE